MAKVYRFTPARRAALRRAQLISARKRKGSGRARKVASHVQRNKGKYTAIGGAAVAVGAAVTYDQVKNVRLYHNTDARHIPKIKRQGLQGIKPGSYSHRNMKEPVGMVFVSKGRNKTKMFGTHQVKIKMNRKEFNKYAKRDYNMPKSTRPYMIHEGFLEGQKTTIKRNGPIGRASYYRIFPDGTKDSYTRGKNTPEAKAKRKSHQAELAGKKARAKKLAGAQKRQAKATKSKRTASKRRKSSKK